MTDIDYTETEMMIKVAADQLENGSSAFVGIGLPVLAANLASRTHAPDLKTFYEGGIYRRTPPEALAFAIDDPVLTSGADYTADIYTTMGAHYRGDIDYSFLGGAQVDKYGNVNSTVIGDFEDPENRIYLTGSGGANDMGSTMNNGIYIVPHDPRKLVDSVDFLTTPGYLDGPGAREEAGFSDGGPHCIITTKGLMFFDDETKEAYLQAYYPGEDIDNIKENTGWDLDIADDVYELDEPSQEEVRLLREEIDPQGMYI
jgi:glutaconate CoA-transferase subunit B